MRRSWALQDAKNKLSEVVDRALREGPQTITRRGKDTAVLLSTEDFQRLLGTSQDLVDFLRSSPLAEAALDLSRSKDPGREVDL